MYNAPNSSVTKESHEIALISSPGETGVHRGQNQGWISDLPNIALSRSCSPTSSPPT